MLLLLLLETRRLVMSLSRHPSRNLFTRAFNNRIAADAAARSSDIKNAQQTTVLTLFTQRRDGYNHTSETPAQHT